MYQHMRKHLTYKLIRLMLAVIPVMIAVAWTPVRATTVIYAGEVLELQVVEDANVHYIWDLYNDPGVNFATTGGNISPQQAYFVGGVNTGSRVEVHWLEPGTYFYRVMASGADGCSNNLKIGIIEVLPSYPTANFIEPQPICIGDTGTIEIILTGEAPWSITYTYSRLGSEEVTTIVLDNIEKNRTGIHVTHSETGTYEYTIVSVTDSSGVVNEGQSARVQLLVNPRPHTSPIYRYDPLSKKSND